MDHNNRSDGFSIRSLVNGLKAVVKQKSYIKSLPFAVAGILVASTFLYMSVPFVEASVANLSPTLVGPANDWSVTPGSGNLAKVSAVQTDDGNSSYIDEDDNNEKQTFVFPNASIPSGSTINSVTLYGIARGTGSGNSDKKMVLVARNNGGLYSNSTDIITNSSYTTHSRVMTANPFTTSPWTLAEVNGWTTTFGVARSNSNGTVRVTKIYLEVDYTLAPQDGTLTVIKHVINDNGGTAVAGDFTITVTGGNASPSSFSGDENGTAVTIDADGSYSVGETDNPTGYHADFTGDCSGTMPAGGQKTCTIVNDDIQPSLTVVKIVEGGEKVISDFPLFVDQTSVTSGEPNNFNAGSYTVSETGDPDYTVSFTDACNSDGVVTLAPGDEVTCTITNSYQTPLPASLTVIKHVINDGIGTKSAGDFTITVDGTDVSESSFAGSEGGTTVTLDEGDYSVIESSYDGYNATYSESCTGTIESGQQITCTITNDDVPVYIISGSKFNDTDNDGTWDEGEPALQGWTIFIDSNNNGTFDEGERSTETNSDGYYSFGGLLPGPYIIAEVITSGWTQTMPGGETQHNSVSIDNQNIENSNFGNHQNPVDNGGGGECTASISGKVFDDTDDDGVFDAGEPGLSGLTIYLDIDNNNELSEGDVSTTTDADGLFHFLGLPNGGIYTVREVVPSGWHLVYPTAADEGEYEITISCNRELTISSFNLSIQAISGNGTDVFFINALNPTGGGGGGGGGGTSTTTTTTTTPTEEVKGEQSTPAPVVAPVSNEEVKGEQTLPVTGTSPLVLLFVIFGIALGVSELRRSNR